MDKKITFLGTGAPDATKYFHSSYLIKEHDRCLLIDTGSGAQLLRQLELAKIPLDSINHVFITHKHTDHILGLFWMLRISASKISKGVMPPLHIYCSEKTAEIIKTIAKLLLKDKVTNLFDDKIIFNIIKDKTQIDLNGWKLFFFDTLSDKTEQFGVKITFNDGANFVTLGDETYKSGLAEICKDCDYFLHEAFCLEKDRSEFKPEKIHHSTVEEAARIAKEINVKNLLLFHTEDKTFNHRKKLYTSEAKQSYSGKVYVPDDLETIILK